MECGEEIGFRLFNETQAELISCSEDGYVELKTVEDNLWVGLHTIKFEVFLKDIDPSGIYAKTLNFTLTV